MLDKIFKRNAVKEQTPVSTEKEKTSIEDIEAELAATVSETKELISEKLTPEMVEKKRLEIEKHFQKLNTGILAAYIGAVPVGMGSALAAIHLDKIYDLSNNFSSLPVGIQILSGVSIAGGLLLNFVLGPGWLVLPAVRETVEGAKQAQLKELYEQAAGQSIEPATSLDTPLTKEIDNKN